MNAHSQEPVADGDNAYADICHEHDEIRELLSEIQDMLARRLGTVARVAEMLGRFCALIEGHFAGEEYGGFFDQILTDAPRLSKTVAQAKLDHKLLREAIHKLLETTREDASPDWWERMKDGFEQFSESLMRHEETERELVSAATDTDSLAHS